MTIFGFRLIAPASLLYLAASFHRKKFLVSTWLGSYALAEAAFYLFVYIPRNHQIQKVTRIPYLYFWNYHSDAIIGRCTPSVFDL
jgi:hypothetical protein